MRICEVKEKYINILLGAAIALGLLILLAANICWSSQIIDSDYATQLMLSKICAEEKSVLTHSWMYSTEIRFINTQIIYGFVFLFTNNWFAVRTVGNMMLYGILALSYFYMMRPVNIQKKWKLLGAVLLLIPFSRVDLSIVFMSTDYIPPICLMFLGLGGFIRCILADKARQKYISYGCMALVFLLAGMNGLRSVLVIAGPLCLMYIWRFAFQLHKMFKREWLCVGVALGAFMLGFIINCTVLMSQYGFGSYAGIRFADLGNGEFIKEMAACVGVILQALGYAVAPVLSLQGIINAVILGFAAVMIYWMAWNERRRVEEKADSGRKEAFASCFLKQFFWISILFNVLFYGLTDNRMMIHRYMIPAVYMMFPAISICLDQEREKIRKLGCLAVILFFFAVGGLRTFYSLAANDINANRYASIQFLQQSDLHFGFATPWNAGVVTELTDGDIEIVNMRDIENGIPMLETCPKKWFYEDYTFTGRPFLFLTQEEYEMHRSADVVSRGELVYEDDYFVIFLYDSKDEVCSYQIVN